MDMGMGMDMEMDRNMDLETAMEMEIFMNTLFSILYLLCAMRYTYV